MDFRVVERVPTWDPSTYNHPGMSSLMPSHLLNQAVSGHLDTELPSCLSQKDLPLPHPKHVVLQPALALGEDDGNHKSISDLFA